MHDFLISLQKSNVQVFLEGENIRVKYHEAQLPEAIFQSLKQYKTQLIDFLKNSQTRQSHHAVPISIVGPQEHYAVSHAQKRLWFLHHLNPGMHAYNISGAYVIDGDLNIEIVRKVFQSLLQRHETLRTGFILVNDEPRQFVETVESIAFDVMDNDLSSSFYDDTNLSSIVDAEAELPFDLAKAPLIRVTVYKLAQNRFLFLLTIHHIIADGWSINLLIKEISTLYEAYLKGLDNPLLPLQFQYKDFAHWESVKLTTDRTMELREFWMNLLHGELPVMNLPVSKARPPRQTFNGKFLSFYMGKECAAQLNQITAESRGSLFTTLVTLVTVLLQKYTGQNDIILGTDSAGRNNQYLEESIGFYLDALILRYKINPDQSLQQLVDYIRRVTFDIFDHQEYPLDILYEDLQVKRDPSRNPVFDVLVILQNFASPARHVSHDEDSVGLEITLFEANISSSIVDLEFTFTEQPDDLLLTIRYNSDLFNHQIIQQLGHHFVFCAGNMRHLLNTSVAEINIFSSEDQKLLDDYSRGKVVTYPAGTAFVDMFNNQVLIHPECIAVEDGNQRITYQELADASDELVLVLCKKYGVMEGQKVTVLLNRSVDLIITLLAIWKMKCIYVPVDPEYPVERVAHIFGDSNSSLIISNSSIIHGMDLSMWKESVILTLDDKKLNGEKRFTAFKELVDCDTAYILYTSGTTGMPKGVVVNHSAIGDYTRTFATYFRLTSDDAVIHQSSISFDTSLEEILPALSAGASVIICKEGGRDVDALVQCISKHRATILSTTPRVIHELNKTSLESLNSLRIIISGGDVLQHADVSELIDCFDVYNTYGPTETTVCAAFFHVKDVVSPVYIGKPISNHHLYIVDEHLRKVPIGVTGEILIAGAGVATGYYNDPGSTAAQFLQMDGIPGPVYRTGDLARMNFDGNLEFMGRKHEADIKIRGYRIALKEIEVALNKYSGVERVFVKVSSSGDSTVIIAYIQCTQDCTSRQLRTFLITRLPGYMIPHHFVILSDLPYNLHGKIDQQKLPQPEISPDDSCDECQVEEGLISQVHQIWMAVLQKNIGRHDNFFELGGHSLNGTRIINRIIETFNIELGFKELFEYPTVVSLAEFIGRNIQKPLHHDKQVIVHEFDN